MSVRYEDLIKAITTVEIDMYEHSRIEDYYLLNLQQSPYGDFKVEFLGIDIWEDTEMEDLGLSIEEYLRKNIKHELDRIKKIKV